MAYNDSMEPVGVSILTNGNRLSRLQKCIDSLLANCSYRPLVIGIHNNGSTDDTFDYLQDLPVIDGIEWRTSHSDVDSGCAKGTNRSIDLVSDMKLQLHIESDFEHLTESESGIDPSWLHRAVDFLQSGKCHYLYLRRMRNEREAQVHWWDQWMPQIAYSKEEYLKCNGFWWSNNPSLFNFGELKKAKILPLNEKIDGGKGTENWSQPELCAGAPPKAHLHQWGMFVHERNSKEFFAEKDCGKFLRGCKYGFWKDPKSNWCSVCDLDKSFRELVEHRKRYNKLKREKSKLKIGCIDNGSGVSSFDRIVKPFGNCERFIMQSDDSAFTSNTAVVIPYDKDFTELLKADVVLFTRVGADNIEAYQYLAGVVPVIVPAKYHGKKIKHEKTGFIYGHESWAKEWIRRLANQKGLLDTIKSNLQTPKKRVTIDEVTSKVTVITPTFRRDPRIVSRCIDCVRLQTMTDIQHLICSDGNPEPEIASLVASVNDKRISYHNANINHSGSKCKHGDFGNVVRSEMLDKASGKYVLFLDDDNLILPHYLETMINAIENSGKDFAVCHAVHFGPLNEDAVGKPPIVLTGIPVKQYHIDTLQVLVKRDVIRDIGWDTENGYLSDGITFERLGKQHDYVEVPEVLGFHM